MIKIAEKRGKYQVQHNEPGGAIIALTNWISEDAAGLVKAGLTGHPRPAVCHICGKEYRHCRCGWGE